MKDQQTFLPFMFNDGETVRYDIRYKMEVEPDILKKRQMKLVIKAIDDYLDLTFSSIRQLKKEIAAHLDLHGNPPHLPE